MTAIGVIGFRYLDRKPPAPAKTIAIPSIVTLPVTTPAPILPTPQINVTVQPPPAEPKPAPPPARALTPFLDVGCLTNTANEASEEGDIVDTRCSWDNGFPAISSDGKTIALVYSNDDGGRGWLNVAVQVIDARTSKVVRDDSIVSADELDPETGTVTDKLLAVATRRVAAIQKRLDDGHYRSMRRIEATGAFAADATPPPGLRLEQEFRDSQVRVVDGDTNTVLWRGVFDASKEYPPRKVDPDTDTGCYPSHTNDVYAWFDPETRAIAFQVSYGSGPCYCSDAVHHYVRFAATP